MPLPLAVLTAGISAGANLLGQGINAITQGNQNRKARQFAIEMYDRQRKDALADWNMQNEYNTPAAQMARFRAAGLNPNLIYGQSNEGATVRSSQAQSWRPEPYRWDLGGVASQGLDAYYQTQIREGQVDMQKAQIANAQEQNKLIAAQVISYLANSDLAKSKKLNEDFKLTLSTALKDYQLQAAELTNKRLQAQTQFTLDENTRRQALQEPNLNAAVARVFQIKAQTATSWAQARYYRNMASVALVDSELKREDLKLKKAGIQPHDSALSRFIQEGINKLLSKGSIIPGTNGKYSQADSLMWK